MKGEVFRYSKGDLFSLNREPPYFNACVGKNGGPYNYYDYSYGYFFAARTVAENVIETQRNLDISVYPLFFLFRHAIELALKHMWQVTNYLLEREGSLYGHDLKFLWKRVELSMKEIDEFKKDGEIIDFLDELIDDIHKIDKSAEAFRFPESLDNNKFLQDRTHINIAVIYKLICDTDEVFGYLFRHKTCKWVEDFRNKT
jgi:hypothetical protein